MENPESIKKENPRESKGVLPYVSNSALAGRDYNIKCQVKTCIIVIKGYWIWWCSSHHQPHHICEREKILENNILIKRK